MDANECVYKYVVEREIGDYYKCLSIKKGEALQSFEAGYHFCRYKTEVMRMVRNAAPPRLAEAIARSIA